MRVLLVSTYELGHQPLGLAAPAAALRAAGHEVRCFDLSVEPLDAGIFGKADLLGVSVPMHTAARLGIELARRARRLAPRAHICFYGLYAAPLHDLLVGDGVADSIVGGEYEAGLVALADALAADRFDPACPPAGVGATPRFDRRRYPVPDRAGLPPLQRYAHLLSGGEPVPAGYVEATRGAARTAAATAPSRPSTAAACGWWSGRPCSPTSPSSCAWARATSPSATPTSSTPCRTRWPSWKRPTLTIQA